jgi:hypothetical protein
MEFCGIILPREGEDSPIQQVYEIEIIIDAELYDPMVCVQMKHVEWL